MIPIALWLAAAAVSWAPHEVGQPIPAGAVRVGEAEALYVCRAQLSDGVHPGVTEGGPCLVPQKGTAQPFDRYELAEGTAWAWQAANWERAVPGGKQRNSDLYVCRARMTAASGKRVFAGGKAYHTGTHAGHCFVAHEGREVDITGDFELLVSR
jgi:hypothetical protein